MDEIRAKIRQIPKVYDSYRAILSYKDKSFVYCVNMEEQYIEKWQGI